MNAENIMKLSAMLQDKLNEKNLAAFKKKLQTVDDSKFGELVAQISNLKSTAVTLLLNFFLFAGGIYLGHPMRTVAWYIVLIIDFLIPVIFLSGGALVEDTEQNEMNSFIIGMIFAGLLGIIVFVWWLIGVCTSSSDTKKENFERMISLF